MSTRCANATRHLDDAARSELATLEADLLAAASRDTIAEFEKDCRDLARLLTGDGGVGELDRQKANSTVRRWIDKVTGMWHLHAEVDPETGAKLWTAIDAQLDSVKQRDGNGEVALEQLTVIALVEVVGATPASNGERRCQRCACTSTCRRLPMVCTPRRSARPPTASRCRSTRSAGCAAKPPSSRSCWAPTVKRSPSGANKRVANRAQRRALRAMYRTCAHPHCDIAFDHCQIHHVIPWERFGLTDLENLLPLCSKHHHLVHEGRWHLTLQPDRTITLHRPDGSHYFTGRTIDRRRQPANDRRDPRPATRPTTRITDTTAA